MAFGVPEDWVDDVRGATEDTLFDVIAHLPQEAQEALLRLAVGEKHEVPQPQPEIADAFAHPDAQRRFRILTNVDDLRRALDFPWEKWAVFLHPAQQSLVTRAYSGPVRVSGSAGTGKTIVALHRAVHLARSNPGKRVLLTTFSKALANSLKSKLVILTEGEPEVAARIVTEALSAVGYDLYAAQFGPPNLAPDATIRALLTEASKAVEGSKFQIQFLMNEWADVVDAWQLHTWEDYRDVARLGRRTRVGGKQREVLWQIFARVREGLAHRKMVTWSDLFRRLTDAFGEALRPAFDFAVVDEAQDVGVAEARFLAAMARGNPNGLFLAGDLGQRIFQQPFSWKMLGLDVRGRAFTLKINYRTSHQIRVQADRLLPSSVSDVDGNGENRRGTVSLFDGPLPTVVLAENIEREAEVVSQWIKDRIVDGAQPDEIAVFVRSEAEMRRARAAAKQTGFPFVELSDKVEIVSGSVAIGTMHYAKGLEFRYVAVMACDEEIVPLQDRIEAVSDESDLKEVYETERHLLYVACTRARDRLLISAVAPGSEFLGDLGG